MFQNVHTTRWHSTVARYDCNNKAKNNELVQVVGEDRTQGVFKGLQGATATGPFFFVYVKMLRNVCERVDFLFALLKHGVRRDRPTEIAEKRKFKNERVQTWLAGPEMLHRNCHGVGRRQGNNV